MKSKSQFEEPAVAYARTYNPSSGQGILQIIQSVKNGFQFEFFMRLVEKIPFSLNEWSHFLHLSERTMQRYKKEEKTFDPIYSERIMEISMLYNYGIEVFGNNNHFDTWLQSKNIALGGFVPKDLLDTTFGITLVKDELARIEHGTLA